MACVPPKPPGGTAPADACASVAATTAGPYPVELLGGLGAAGVLDVSYDGSAVVMRDGFGQIVRLDRLTGTRAVVAPTADQAAISGDGKTVVLAADEALLPSDIDISLDVYRWTAEGGLSQVPGGSNGWFPSGAAIDTDCTGATVAMQASSAELGVTDVLVVSTASGITVRAGAALPGLHDLTRPTISSDGRWIAMQDEDRLVAGSSSIQRFDRIERTTELVSRGPDGLDMPGNDMWPAISADGAWVAWGNITASGTPGATAGVRVWAREVREGAAATVIGDLNLGFGTQSRVAISRDGRVVAFTTNTPSPWVVPPLPEIQVAVARRTGAAEYTAPTTVSVTVSGAPANGNSLAPLLAGSGAALVFTSLATNLPVAPAQPGSFNGYVVLLDATR